MEDGWSVRMAESLPTLSRPESEEAKPGSWEADGSPATGQRLYGEWRLGPTGNLWVAWTAETGFRPGIFWVHHSLVHSHPKIAASTSLLSSSGHSEPGRNHMAPRGYVCPGFIQIFQWALTVHRRPPALPPLMLVMRALGTTML